ncbi:MAG: hypothetical protein Q8O55_11390 [Dehalococcoidales bacterium]|nr:hypothetical protein [Dehalococcoidales bacterium]
MTFDWIEPVVNHAINRLTYQWDTLDLLVEADRITDAGQAELWFYHSNGTGNKLLHIAKVNLLSSSTMTQLSKRMLTHSADIPWEQALTFITKTTMEYQRQGEPAVLLQPVSAEALKPTYYIEPVIIKGVPNIIYGDKGVNKTTLSLTMLGLIEIGEEESSCELIPLHTTKTAMLDWESTEALTNYTLARLVEGKTLPYFELNYLRCKAPLADDIQRIGNFLHDCRAEVVLIDSLGKAAGSDKFDSSGKGAALKFFECLSQLNVTPLIIAQNAKGEGEGKKTIFGSTYYTYYARNIFELKGKTDEVNTDRSHIALFHTESNYSKIYPTLGFCVDFTDTTINITREAPSLSLFLERASQMKTLLEFLESGAKTRQAVAEQLAISPKHAGVLLNRALKKNTVTNLGSGLWGLIYQDNKVG